MKHRKNRFKGELEQTVHCSNCWSSVFSISAWPGNNRDVVFVCENCGSRYAGEITFKEQMKIEKG